MNRREAPDARVFSSLHRRHHHVHRVVAQAMGAILDLVHALPTVHECPGSTSRIRGPAPSTWERRSRRASNRRSHSLVVRQDLVGLESVYGPYRRLGGGDLMKGFEVMNQSESNRWLHAASWSAALAGVVAARRNRSASDHVAPGNVIAQSAAIQISAWTYICSAIKGSSKPLAIRNARAVLSRPLPVNTIVANSVATLMKL